jgi:hypothetical protein
VVRWEALTQECDIWKWLSDGIHLPPSRDIYILALAELQSVNESDPLSYFKLAGK